MDQEVSNTFNDLERKLKAFEDELGEIDPEARSGGDLVRDEDKLPVDPIGPEVDLVSDPKAVDDRPLSATAGESAIRWDDEPGTIGADGPAGGVGETSIVWDEQLSERRDSRLPTVDRGEIDEIEIDQEMGEPVIDWGEQRAAPDDQIPPTNAGETMNLNDPISSPLTYGTVTRGPKLASYQSQLERIARELSEIASGLSEDHTELLRFRTQLEQAKQGLIEDYERLLSSLRDDGDPPASY